MKLFLRKFMVVVYLFQLSLTPAIAEVPDAAEDGTFVSSLTDITSDGDDIIVNLTQLAPYQVFTLDSPSRLVLEIQGVLYKTGFVKKELNTDLVRRVRGYQFKENPLISRVVIDLKAPVDYKTNVTDSAIVVTLKKNEVLSEKPAKKEPAPKKSSSSSASRNRRDLLGSLPREVVTLDFEGADIRDVIRLMSETSNINIIYGPEVTGNITIHLKKVPFDEAFGTIMNLKGLVATQLGTNILRVTTPEILQQEQSKAVVFTKSIPINYLKADEVQRHLQAVMSSAGRKGNITVVRETNSLVVTDSQEGIAQSERLIAQLDKRPAQVMIEARIVEINLTNGLDIGVQWEFGKQDTNGDKFRYVGLINDEGDARISHKVGGSEDGVGALTPASGGTGVSLPVPGGANAGITFGFINNDSILSATLAALVNQSKARILSSPKVVTINGQEAKIEAVQNIPFRTSTVSGTGVVSNSFTNVDAGIKLTVTPTINAEDRITLRINPESSFQTTESTEAGPIIRTRTAQTTVIVKDGDTLVIGGLIDDQDQQAVNKVPLLGDIPIIGVFFRSNVNRKTRNELLVFVTPRIVRE